MLRAAVEPEFALKAADEKTWPLETDCDRLDQAFDELDRNGIIAMQNAGYTLSDGHHEVGQVLYGRDRNRVKGYCFYHGQDLERAALGGGLMIAFGDLDAIAEQKTAVGHLVKKTLESHGFAIEWDGSPEKRLMIPDIDWKRRLKK